MNIEITYQARKVGVLLTPSLYLLVATTGNYNQQVPTTHGGACREFKKKALAHDIVHHNI